MKSSLACLAAAACLFLPACATLAAGNNTTVLLRGQPGTRFETNTGLEGHVPATVELPNGVAVDIRYDSDMDGELDATHQSIPTRSGASAGNLVAGGLVGMVVDASNPKTRVHQRRQVLGKPYRITLPDHVIADLKKNGVTAEEFLDWPEYRRSQAEVNLTDREFKMWKKYNTQIRDQYQREAQEAVARIQANQSGGIEEAVDAASERAEAKREAQMPAQNG